MDLAKVSDEQRDLLIKGDGAALLSPAIGSSEGCGSAVKFILTSADSDDDGCKMAKNKLEKGKISVEEEIGAKGSISAEDFDLLIKGGGAALRSSASGSSEGSGSAVKFIFTGADSDDDGCKMAKNKLETGKISVEEEMGAKGSISAEDLDLLIKGGGTALPSPASGSREGSGSAVKFIFTSADSDDDGCKMAKNKLEKGKISVEEKMGAKGSISAEDLDLLIKGGGAAVRSPASGCSERSGSAVKFIFTSADSDDDGCKMAKNKLEKGKISVEEEMGAKGSISPETWDLLIKAGAIIFIGYSGGAANACVFILKYGPSPGDFLEMVENRFEKTKRWTEKAKNWYETSKSWTEEKIRAAGISDEYRDLAVNAAEVLLTAAAAAGYFRGLRSKLSRHN